MSVIFSPPDKVMVEILDYHTLPFYIPELKSRERSFQLFWNAVSYLQHSQSLSHYAIFSLGRDSRNQHKILYFTLKINVWIEQLVNCTYQFVPELLYWMHKNDQPGAFVQKKAERVFGVADI